MRLLKALAVGGLVLLGAVVLSSTVAVGGLLWLALPEDPPAHKTRLRDVQALEAVLPLIEERRTTVWDPACGAIADDRGTGADRSEGRCDDPAARPLDETAKKRFDDIQQALDATAVDVKAIRARFDGDALIDVEFSLEHRRWDRWAYVYCPAILEPPDLGGKVRYERINAGWLWRWEDWN